MPRQGNKGKSSSGSKSVKLGPGFPPQLLNRLLRSQRRCIPFRNTFLTMYNTSQCSRGIPNKSDSEQKQDNFYYSSPKAATDMGVSSSESHDLTAFYEMLSASFGVLSQNTGFYPSLDRIIETTLGPLNLGPGGGSYNELISRLHRLLTMDTSDCTYCCNQTSSPASQSNERKAAPREIKKPLAVVPPPTIYVLSKNSPRSLNIQVELTSLTSLASISTSMLLDSDRKSTRLNSSH